jgi:hypothetical protein
MTNAQMHALLDKICADMAKTIRGVTGMEVEVVCRDAEHWTVIGSDAAVRAARSTLEKAGLILSSTHYDPTPDADGDCDTDRYDYWQRNA